MIYRVKKKESYLTLRIRHTLQLALSLQIIISTGPELAGNIYPSCRLFISPQSFSGAPCARLSVPPHLKNVVIYPSEKFWWSRDRTSARPSAPQAYKCKITQKTGMATQMQLDGAGEGPAKEKRIFALLLLSPLHLFQGLLFLLSRIFLWHKTKDGSFNSTNINKKLSPGQNTPA